ncbi:MAG: hypothetical protein JRH01_24135 [Deltaproteobacteria bacterium]|nr:hypothetical protein [Deltaproteobacteria bacterium]
MDPSYETVIDITNLVWTLLVYGLHGAIAFFHAALACYLLASGVHGLFLPEVDGAWIRRLGVADIGAARARHFGALRLLLGLLLFAPLLLGAPAMVSLFAGIAAFLLLLVVERGLSETDRSPGRFVRVGAIGFAAVASLFMIWEGEDNLVLSADLLLHASEWRNEELNWQLSLDPKSPKVGDIAPDFELQDPEGNVQVRLSDFRGKRPVALVFGSYT